MACEPLPIDALQPRILAALRDRGALVLCAPPGAGKTTRVPPAILRAGLAGDGAVVVLEPRRLAARAAARRVALELGGEVGGEVGFEVRFDRQVSSATRIRFVTDGVFLRQVAEDPLLSGVGAVVFDEFHERSLDLDLSIALARRVRDDVRPDLRLVAMSATGEVAPAAAYLGGEVVEAEGRVFPVEVAFLDRRDERPLAARVAAGVARALAESPGGVLVFLPGVGEIRGAAKAVAAVVAHHGAEVLELFGDLSPERQDAVLRPGPRRKVVLATNVAETSVTVEGVTAVVDAGLARVLEYDPARGLSRLALRRVSRAAADQRAGRAGRTAPGLCIRLWTAVSHRALAEREEPEVRRADLAGAVLTLLAWGESDPAAFPWFEPPPERSLRRAGALLGELGAVRGGRLTDVGREMARLPVHPRLGRLLVEGRRLGVPRRAALAAALLSERDPFAAGEAPAAAAHRSDSDLLDRVEALERGDRVPHPGAARLVLRARDQLARLLGAREDRAADRDEALLRAVTAAFADRLARRRAAGSDRFVMARGGSRLEPSSAVRDAELIVAVEMKGGGPGGEARVRQASAVRREWLPEDRLESATDLFFDEAARRVAAVHRVRFGRLVLSESPTALPEDGRVAEVLAAAAADRLAEALPLDDPAVRAFLDRVACLRGWMPDLGLPEIGDAELRGLLPALAAGRRSFAELRKAPLMAHLGGLLSPARRAALDRHAPERIALPGGARVRLSYERGRPPVLAARIQQVFGLSETPRVAGGRVPVLLHLLAPNGRPQQITDDLASFWRTVYPRVRQELRRRYPKHAWPESGT